jgi:hypothetical protein
MVDVRSYRGNDGTWVRGHHAARPGRFFAVGGYVVVAAFWVLLVLTVIFMLRHG